MAPGSSFLIERFSLLKASQNTKLFRIVFNLKYCERVCRTFPSEISALDGVINSRLKKMPLKFNYKVYTLTARRIGVLTNILGYNNNKL